MLNPEKRQAILESATEIFLEKGLYRAKVEEIAEKAGIAKGTVYLYFKSKRQIFLAVFQQHLEGYFAEIEHLLSLKETAAHKLLILIRFHLSQIGSFAKLVYPDVHSEPFQWDDEMFKEVLGVQRRVQGAFARILEQGMHEGVFRPVDALHAALCLQGILRIHLESALLQTDPNWPDEELSQKIYDLFVQGLEK